MILDTEALKQFLAARRNLTTSPDTPSATAAANLSRASSLPPSLQSSNTSSSNYRQNHHSQPYHYQLNNPSLVKQRPAPSTAPTKQSSFTRDESVISPNHTWSPQVAPISRYPSDSELAATGRRGGGTPPSSQHFEASHHAFSKLMQTDDVSSIAEQIASQAELIYQTWKTTGLNPNQLIRYHSISTESGDEADASARSVTPVPRTPGRSISPAPPGSSPAVPRRVLDNSIVNGRQYQQQQQYSPKLSQTSAQHQQSTQHQHGDFYAQKYQHSVSSPPQLQHQQKQQHQQQPNYHQQPLYQNNQVQQLQNQRQHSSSPVRTLNTSPRPYVAPSSHSSSPLRSPPASLASGSSSFNQPSSPRAYVTSPTSPPQPPERSSSYTGSDQSSENLQILSDPKLEVSLRDLVNTFVLEDKARHGFSSRLNERPKSAPSSIQDALQRFERQMAITSRTVPTSNEDRHPDMTTMTSPLSPQFSQNEYAFSSTHQSSPNSNLGLFSQSNAVSSTSNSSLKRLHGIRGDTSSTDAWQKGNTELDFRSRRSVSPSPPPLAQPGWNEPSQSNTSTWPLKLKQQSTSPLSSSYSPPASISVSPPKTNSLSPSSNYVTTLETRVEGGSTSSIPVRHKVINLGPPTQEERILQSLRSSSLIQESEKKRLNAQQQQSHNIPGSVVGSSVSTSHITTVSSTSRQKPKFSISVTVDVDQVKVKDADQTTNRIRPTTDTEINQLSSIDYAKARYQEAQQYSKTSGRLQDERNTGPRLTNNIDGRVLNAKSRFEPGESAIRPFDPVLSTLPEFYRRKLRKMQRKSGSPEPLAGVLATLPHPELTDQQKAHIRERSQSPTAAAFHAAAGAAAIRPFLTQGSVAERVMIFERAPVEMKAKSSSELSHFAQERRRPLLPYRDPDSVRSKAQVSKFLL